MMDHGEGTKGSLTSLHRTARQETEERLLGLIEDFLERRRAGLAPDPYEIILANPDLAAELERRLEVIVHLYGPTPPPAPPAGAASAEESNPRFVARYRIEAKIGDGTFGVVYRAYDPKFDRFIALKVLKPDPGGDLRSTQRFLDEARITARLRHPHIVPLHDVGVDAGRRFFDMELIEGVTLQTHLRRHQHSPMNYRDAAELIYKVAGALDYAHGMSLVHRDVKPENILIDASGEPQLTDFGLARRAAADEPSASRSALVGTPAYMSPEQADGRGDEVDGRADVFSLGVVLYEMLTGRRPFGADNVEELLRQIRDDPPLRPRQRVATVPLDLELICLKALEKKPEDRFPTAEEMATELGRWLNGGPTSLRRQTRRERLRRWVRDNKVKVSIGAMLMLMMLVIGGGLLYRSIERHYERLRQEEARQRDKQQQDALRQATVLIWEARHKLGAPMWGRVAIAHQLLREALREAAKLPAGEQRAGLERDIRSAFVRSLGVPDQKPERREDRGMLPGIFSQSWPVALHPDGKRMAVGLVKRQGGEQPIVWERGTPWPWPPSRHGELDPDAKRPRLAYTPDGRFLIFLPSTGGVQLWDGFAEHRLAVWSAKEPHPVVAVGFTPDGSRVWCCNAAGRVFALALPTLCEASSWFVPAQGELTAVAFSHDATRLAVGDATGTIRLYLADPTPTVRDLVAPLVGAGNSPLIALTHLVRLPIRPGTLMEPDGFAVSALAWSPDGARLAVGSASELVHLWNIESGERLWSARSFGEAINTLRFHPTEEWLFGGTVCTGGGFWNTTTGTPVLQVAASRLGGFAADGLTLASGQPTNVAFIDFAIPHVVRKLHGSSSPSYRRAWSREGQYLASLDRRFGVQVWDVSRSAPADQFLPPRGEGLSVQNAAVALSDDGRYLGYASGGELNAWLVVRDVWKHVTVGTYRLKGGFETLGYSEDRFWLVREEDEGNGPYRGWPNPRRVQSVVYELEVGKAPRRLHVLRPSEAKDERRFLDQTLTPDGRYYLWVGPRLPPESQRAEVWDVRNQRLVARVSCPVSERRDALGVYLDPLGRHLSFEATGIGCRVYELPDTTTFRTAERPSRISADGQWQVECDWSKPGSYRLRRAGAEKVWLEFALEDRNATVHDVLFSPDSRSLVWNNRDGTLTLLDLSAAEARVREFESKASVEKEE